MNHDSKQTEKETFVTSSDIGTKNSSLGLTSLFEVLWPHRKRIGLIVLCTSIVIAGLCLMMHSTYEAQTTILPDLELMNLAGKLGGLQEIASAAGIGNQIVSPSQLYPDILASERVLQNVIYHKYRTESFPSEVTLIQFYGYDDEDSVYNYEKCLKKLRGSLITIEVDRKTTIVTLKVTTTEKQLSADIANQITAELDYYQRNFRRTNASEQRKFLEQRLSEVNQDLTKSEEKLKDFREKNRKVEQSPQLLLEQDRFARDVELNSALFIELKKQYELAKLDEIKNTPIVQVLDVARAPAKKSGPPRRIYVFAAAFLSFVGCTSWYGLSHRLNQLRDEDHAFAQVYDTVAQSLIQTISKVGKVLPKSKTEKSASS